MIKPLSYVLFFIFSIFSFCSTAQSEPLDIMLLTEELNFDGKLDEAFWVDMTSISTIQHLPYNGKEPAEEAEIYICYDKQYLYLAANIKGNNISSPSKKRDEFSLKPDYLGIFLDGYLDKENALGFLTTPAGLRTDFTIYEDAVGQFPINLDWNTYWDVKTHRTLGQWSVEIRIPFSSLQFQEVDGEVEMGLTIWRFNADKNEASTFPAIKDDWGGWSAFKPSQAQVVRFKGIKSAKPMYISPYALAGLSRKIEENAPYDPEYGNQLEIGVDAKYSLTSNLTLDLTVNTDFAQVEADDAQVNLDRFSLFFPEKRQFFQERASIFGLRVGGPNRIFYSRRIGIDDDGNLEKILGGVRLTGRVGNYDVGLINMLTREDNWSPKNNFSVARIRKKVLNENSYLGFLGTNKTDFKGGFNSVYALDGTFRLKGNHLLKLRFAQSFTDKYENKALSMDPTRFIVNLEKVQFSGFTYDLAFGRSGKDYNPEMGFESRDNFTAIFAILGYGWRSSEESKIWQQRFRMYNFTFIDNETNKDETSNVGLSFQTDWKKGHSLTLFTYFRRERLFEPVTILDGFSVEAGLYPINVWSVGFYTPSSRKFQYFLDLKGGDVFDSKYFSISQSVEWVVYSDLSLSLFYNYNPIFKQSWTSGDVINVHLTRLKFLYTLNTKLSLSGFVQGTSEGKLGLGNIRFRYNQREGVDLFLVYNNVTDLDLAFGQNNFRRGVAEQVFLAKFTYTFRL